MHIEFDLTDSSFNTQFAPLAALSAHYQHNQVLAPLEKVVLQMKSRDFSPVCKLKQVLLSILTGCETLTAYNRQLDGEAGLATITAIYTTAPAAGGRYTLQFGAWSDRSRALDMLRRYRDQLPDLHIVESRDDRGQLLYKVRGGAYANPAMARTAARRLKDRLGLDVVDGTRISEKAQERREDGVYEK